MRERHGKAVVAFAGTFAALLAWRIRVADLTGAEGEYPRRSAGGMRAMRIRLTPGDLHALATAQWPGDSGLDSAAGDPMRWNELLTCADMPAARTGEQHDRHD